MDNSHLRSLDVAMDSAESPVGDLIYFLSRGSTIYSTPTAATADSLVAGLESAAVHWMWYVDQAGIRYLSNDLPGPEPAWRIP